MEIINESCKERKVMSMWIDLNWMYEYFIIYLIILNKNKTFSEIYILSWDYVSFHTYHYAINKNKITALIIRNEVEYERAIVWYEIHICI